MHLDTDNCANMERCGQPAIRNLIAIQPEREERSWQQRVEEMVAHAHHICNDEIIAVITDSPSEPYMIGLAKEWCHGEPTLVYTIDHDYDGEFGPMRTGTMCV